MRLTVFFMCVFAISCGDVCRNSELQQSLKEIADSYSKSVIVKDSILADRSSILLTVDEHEDSGELIMVSYYEYILCCHYPFVNISGTRIYIDTARVTRILPNMRNELPSCVSCNCDSEKVDKWPLPTYDPIIWYLIVEKCSSHTGARLRRAEFCHPAPASLPAQP